MKKKNKSQAKPDQLSTEKGFDEDSQLGKRTHSPYNAWKDAKQILNTGQHHRYDKKRVIQELEDVSSDECRKLISLITGQRYSCYSAAKEINIPYRFAKVIYRDYLSYQREQEQLNMKRAEKLRTNLKGKKSCPDSALHTAPLFSVHLMWHPSISTICVLLANV